MNLDFSIISDDQLVELIRAGLQEAVRRGQAVEAAVRAAGLDEAEKARIAKEAAEREARRIHEEEARRIAAEAAERVRRETETAATKAAADKQKDIWAKKEALARRMRAIFEDFIFPDVWSVKMWKKESTREVRVFMEFGYDNKLATYYHTGNNKCKPESVEIYDKDFHKLRKPIIEFCKELCETWNHIEFTVPADPYRTVEWWIVQTTSKYYVLEGDDLTKVTGNATRFPSQAAAQARIDEIGESLKAQTSFSFELETVQKTRKDHYRREATS